MISVVVPTIRPESFETFYDAWLPLFKKHSVQLIVIHDGDIPSVEYVDIQHSTRSYYSVSDIMGEYDDVIYNRSDCVRNVGFALAGKLHADIILSLDDDVRPLNDTISSHCTALGRRVPVSWLSTTVDSYMRGFPYNVRTEAKVIVSHGVWEGIPDLDAPTQLLHGDMQPSFYQGVIPKGALYPHCAMNFAFTREALPYVYQAPMGYKVGLDRFGDIWGGIEMKKDLDAQGYAVVSGYARVFHTRASDVFTNLQKEAKGLAMNESYGTDEYFSLFYDKRERWKEYIYGISQYTN